jgi:glycine cleavage system H lipoate-binding protein
LSNNIYAVAATRPVSENELAFLSWILNDGQKLLASNGYCNLTSSETKTGIAALTGTTAGNIPETKTASSPSPWPMILTVSGLIALFFVIFILSKRSVKSSATDQQIHIAPLLIENAIHVPRGLYFDKTHTWAFMEKDGNVKVGVDDFLQHITGKLSKIMMKEPGETVRKGEKIVTIIQNGKQLNLYAPISGTILQQNKLLMSDSSLINLSPYTDGWVYLIEPRNWRRESQFLLMGEKYIEWLRDEFVRLREFISASVKTNNLVYAHVVLQDGGELTDNVLSDMEPEVWEDFQTRFIDTSR